MKKILTFIMATSFCLSAQATTPEDCGNVYWERYEWLDGNTGVGDLIGHMYSKETMDFYNDGQGGAFSMGVTVLAFPVLLPLDIGIGISDGVKKRRIRNIGASILDPESKFGKKGTKKLYKLAKKEVRIKKKEFIEFFNKDFNKVALCGYGAGMVLTEKGKALVGERGFYIFMHESHGTPLWDEFWNDPRNYKNEMSLSTLDKKELRSALTEALLEAGFERK